MCARVCVCVCVCLFVCVSVCVCVYNTVDSVPTLSQPIFIYTVLTLLNAAYYYYFLRYFHINVN